MASKAIQKEFRVLCKVDEPVKQGPLTLPAGTTFAQLRESVAKAFDMKLDVVSRYGFYSVAFGHDILPLGKTDAEVLVDAGVRDRSVLFVRAPLDLKPVVERKTKKQLEAEAAEEAAGSYDPERFAGITAKNVWDKLKDAKTDAKKKKVCFEFIETFTPEAFKQQSAINELSLEALKPIFASDKLSCSEGLVFDVLMGWGAAELKRQEKAGDKKVDLKGVMKEVLPLIRFPTMDMSDVATRVTPSGMLSNEQILALYTYLGTRPQNISASDKLPPLPSALSVFKGVPRVGSTVAPIWDPTQPFTYGLYTVSSNGRTCTKSSQSGTIYVLREKEARTGGVHVIRLRCDTAGANDQYQNDAIGFANETYNYSCATLQNAGAAMVNPNGQFYVDNSVRCSGVHSGIQSGTVLTYRLDMVQKTVTVQKGSEPAVTQQWHSMSNRVYFALCFRNTGWSFTVL